MIEIELPDLEWQGVVLRPEQRQTKDVRIKDGRSDDITGYSSLGQPVSMKLTPERVSDDQALVGFMEERAGVSDFYLIHLGCTFNPPADDPVVWASLQVFLSRVDGVPEPLPIAWSMTPQRLTAPVESQATARLGAHLKFVEAEIQRTTTLTDNQIYVEALFELEPRPGWQFSRTKSAELHGVQRMSLVAMVPAAVEVRYSLELKASIERKRWGLIGYQADLAGSVKRTYSLGA